MPYLPARRFRPGGYYRPQNFNPSALSPYLASERAYSIPTLSRQRSAPPTPTPQPGTQTQASPYLRASGRETAPRTSRVPLQPPAPVTPEPTRRAVGPGAQAGGGGPNFGGFYGVDMPDWLNNLLSGAGQGLLNFGSQVRGGFPELRGDIGRAAQATVGEGEAGIPGAFRFLGNLGEQIGTPQQSAAPGPFQSGSDFFAEQAGPVTSGAGERPPIRGGVGGPLGGSETRQWYNLLQQARAGIPDYYQGLGAPGLAFDGAGGGAGGGGFGGGFNFDPADPSFWLQMLRWLI